MQEKVGFLFDGGDLKKGAGWDLMDWADFLGGGVVTEEVSVETDDVGESGVADEATTVGQGMLDDSFWGNGVSSRLKGPLAL